MDKALVKICGLTDANLAYQTALAGCDYIGINFAPTSKRAIVNILQALEIASAAKAGGAIPVAIFVNQQAEEMQTICDVTGIEVVQLHGSTARRAHHHLSSKFQRIIASGKGFDAALETSDPHRDLLLFDHENPGLGQSFNWGEFKYNGAYRFGIAGGLNASNVKAAIQLFKPALVDVATGVENAKGQKDLKLIKQFILNVREAYEPNE